MKNKEKDSITISYPTYPKNSRHGKERKSEKTKKSIERILIKSEQINK
jgi:hypothetical protein